MTVEERCAKVANDLLEVAETYSTSMFFNRLEEELMAMYQRGWDAARDPLAPTPNPLAKLEETTKDIHRVLIDLLNETRRGNGRPR